LATVFSGRQYNGRCQNILGPLAGEKEPSAAESEEHAIHLLKSEWCHNDVQNLLPFRTITMRQFDPGYFLLSLQRSEHAGQLRPHEKWITHG
jgi:hypothetical protein